MSYCETCAQAIAESLAWDTEARIHVKVPLGTDTATQRLPVALDSLLPRLVQLATQRGDRQTKALAAEALHALVLYMVSVIPTDTQTHKQTRQI